MMCPTNARSCPPGRVPIENDSSVLPTEQLPKNRRVVRIPVPTGSCYPSVVSERVKLFPAFSGIPLCPIFTGLTTVAAASRGRARFPEPHVT